MKGAEAAGSGPVAERSVAGGELLPLTVARGIAAWWVVAFHLHFHLPALAPGPLRTFLLSGNLAVDFFFVLSGFVIQLSWSGRLTAGAGYREFLFARLARVYPLHLLLLGGFALYFGAAAAFGPSTLSDRQPLYLLLSLFLVQNWGFTADTAWNVPAWSISAEAAAYLLFPILLAVLRPAVRRTHVLLVWLVLLSLSLHGWFRLLDYPFPDAVAQTGLVRCLVQFAAGMIVCELYRRAPRSGGLSASLLAAAAALGAAWFLLRAPVVPLAWGALILGLAVGAPRLLSAAPLVWLGRISYATYLSHYFLLMLFKYAFVGEAGAFSPSLALAYVATLVLASAILYHGFERPAQRWMLDWRRAHKAREADAIAGSRAGAAPVSQSGWQGSA